MDKDKLIQKKLGSSVSLPIFEWFNIHDSTSLLMKESLGDKTKMYFYGMRSLSISEKSLIDLKDESGKRFTLFFKRGSLIAYGDGYLYYKEEDLIDN